MSTETEMKYCVLVYCLHTIYIYLFYNNLISASEIQKGHTVVYDVGIGLLIFQGVGSSKKPASRSKVMGNRQDHRTDVERLR